MQIYLDVCTIQRPLDDGTQLRIRIEAEAVLGIIAFCESGRGALIDSDALRFETSRNAHPVRRSYTEEVLAGATRFAPSTAAVEQLAEKYVALGIKALDALHLASAIEAGADYFCTCDDKLLRRARIVDTGATRVVSVMEMSEEIES